MPFWFRPEFIRDFDFAYSSERLLPEYYRRWVRNPLAIDAQTKMPVYFEEGKSPLT